MKINGKKGVDGCNYIDDNANDKVGESDEDVDTIEDGSAEIMSVVIEVMLLAPNSEYDVYLYREHLAKDGTKTGLDPSLFPLWESIDKESWRTELLAASKDKNQSQSPSALSSVEVLGELGREGRDSTLMKFMDWWKRNPGVISCFKRESSIFALFEMYALSSPVFFL
eukprot:884729-Ditylum_brightwellii.AAC.1